MRGLVLITLFFSALIVNGQTSYKGGEGDGYGSTTVILQSVGFENNQIEPINIYPSILSAGQAFKVNTNDQIDEIFMIDVNGNRQHLNGKNSFLLPDEISNGLYTLWIESNNNYRYVKLVVID